MALTKSQLNTILSGCQFDPVGSSLSSIIVGQINEFTGDSNEIAMFLAHLMHESNGFMYRKEISGGVGQPYGTKYCGRGFIQLTWDYNYKAASLAIFGDNRLLNDPEAVSNSDELAMRVSVWFWKTVVQNIKGPWRKNFGMTTKAINPIEGGPWNEVAKRRYGFYLKAASILGVAKPASDEWE